MTVQQAMQRGKSFEESLRQRPLSSPSPFVPWSSRCKGRPQPLNLTFVGGIIAQDWEEAIRERVVAVCKRFGKVMFRVGEGLWSLMRGRGV